jgi:UDP-N-acetylmuramoyl-tripeptide--D-alanyl-D-alanine ligase
VKLSFKEVAVATGGWVERLGAGVAGGVSVDTRTLREGDLFVALRGPNFDGHAFTASAAARGAAGMVVEEGAGIVLDPAAERGVPFVVRVPDTLRALGDLAATVRRQYQGKVIAVTGSNGKTTTKEMIAAILAVRWKVARSPGNFNNLVGVPLSIFGVQEEHQALVVEAGMNRPGEIGRLTDIAFPDVGVITSIAAAHLEHLGGMDGIRDAKGELLERMKSNAVAVLNADDPLVMSLSPKFTGRVVTFGLRPGLDVRAEKLVARVDGETSFDLVTSQGRARVVTSFLGVHNVQNALAAAAAAGVLGFSLDEVREGLGRCRPIPQRLEPVSLPDGIRVINDCYNANPGSVRAAVETFLSLVSRGGRCVLLGDMLELGGHAREAHEEIGAFMARSKVDLLVTVGRESEAAARAFLETAAAGQRVRHLAGIEEAAAFLARELKPGDLLLVKGSRGMALERVIPLLEAGLRGRGSGREA